MKNISELKLVLEKVFKNKNPYFFPTDPSAELYDKLFGKPNSNYKLDTPYERIKMGANQKNKFLENKVDRDRKFQMGIAYETLTNPMIILEENRENQKPVHIYVRSYFTDDYKTMLSVVVYQNDDGKTLMTSISSHLMSVKDFLNEKINENNKIIYIEKDFFKEIKEINSNLYDAIIKDNNGFDISSYNNNLYDPSKILTRDELEKFRTNKKDIEDILKEEKGKEELYKILDKQFAEKFKLMHFDKVEFIKKINENLVNGEDSWDVADLMIINDYFAKNLKDMKKDMETAFNKNLDISYLEVLPYYTQLVISYIDNSLNEYKENCQRNQKNINKDSYWINKYLKLDGDFKDKEEKEL